MKISIIGLGYVGLPLAAALSKKYDVTGFDVDSSRIKELVDGYDRTAELDADVLKKLNIKFTEEVAAIQSQDIYIVTVPTPVDKNHKPDLTIIKKASQTIGKILSKGTIVVYESTVYPGVTEDICGKILEDESGLKCGVDFFLGYSPERINPGDKKHTIHSITKVVAGQNTEVTKKLEQIYSQVTDVFVAKDIKTAEAAKVIENAQRDINIAFINEITQIFSKLNISIYDVLDAAKTKWNFLPFTPGLVGGHCIGVDPYYLAECSRQVGHNPEVILSGRRTNDAMGSMIANQVHHILADGSKYGESKKILILGLTFKENIPDLRNSKVIDVIKGLQNFGYTIDVVDPHANREEAYKEYGVKIKSLKDLPESDYQAALLLVSHDEFIKNQEDIIKKVKPEGLIFDIKKALNPTKIPKNFRFTTL
jgi:UDP-N-acetyl-D-galactosamine dehydrogenase